MKMVVPLTLWEIKQAQQQAVRKPIDTLSSTIPHPSRSVLMARGGAILLLWSSKNYYWKTTTLRAESCFIRRLLRALGHPVVEIEEHIWNSLRSRTEKEQALRTLLSRAAFKTSEAQKPTEGSGFMLHSKGSKTEPV